MLNLLIKNDNSYVCSFRGRASSPGPVDARHSLSADLSLDADYSVDSAADSSVGYSDVVESDGLSSSLLPKPKNERSTSLEREEKF